jgi:hypothetical protein
MGVAQTIPLTRDEVITAIARKRDILIVAIRNTCSGMGSDAGQIAGIIHDIKAMKMLLAEMDLGGSATGT